MNDGGPAYPQTSYDGRGMSLRERFAVAIAGNGDFIRGMGRFTDGNPDSERRALLSSAIYQYAQALTDEAIKRRGKDAEANPA